jgi:uncharacterized protein (TIGR03032 family)
METKKTLELSSGFVAWLIRHQVSLVCSSYQTRRLVFIGSQRSGKPAISSVLFPGAMGLAAFSQRLYLAGRSAILRLENTLRSDELVDDRFDRLFVPRNAQITGDLMLHEIGVETSGRIVFVNTRYSCLATVSMTHAFKPLWKPPFISKLAAEDRCHLNGLAMENGKARYVTACSTTDAVEGWRDHRHDGGVLVDVNHDRILADGLSMPHSPRVHNGSAWVLNSGTGYLCRVDVNNGRRENVAFCPGFLRGLVMIGHYAVATMSLPRNGRFQGLALDDELLRRKVDPWCGLVIIDTRHGDVVEWARLGSEFVEMFNVDLILGTRASTAIAPESLELQEAITFEEVVEFARVALPTVAV